LQAVAAVPIADTVLAAVAVAVAIARTKAQQAAVVQQKMHTHMWLTQ